MLPRSGERGTVSHLPSEMIRSIMLLQNGVDARAGKTGRRGGILESNARWKISYEHVFYMIIPLLSGGEEWKGMLA